MADNAYAGQAQACLIRVARLDDNGAPDWGADNLYVSEGLIQLDWSPNIDDGDELEQADGCGNEKLFYSADDNLRDLELSMQIVAPEPELLEMLAGGTIHTLSDDTVGYGIPGPGPLGGSQDVSIELWERIIVDGSIADYARYVFPRTRKWRRTGSTHQNDVLNVELEGTGVEAGSWGNGPGDDWNLLSDEAVTIYDWAIETQTRPTATNGAQELAS